MSLFTPKSNIHHHLTHRVGKKNTGLHTVTKSNNSASTLKRPSPFGEIKFEQAVPEPAPVYKSILPL